MEPWIWAVVIALFLIIEFVTVQIVAVWFAVGSLAALILSFIPGVDILWQILTAIIVALIAMAFTRKFVLKLLTKEAKTNIDALEGKELQLITAITKSQTGTVELNGVIWMAVSENPIKAGVWVKIIKLDGNKIVVDKLESQPEPTVVEEPAVVKEKPITAKKPAAKKTAIKTTVKNKGGK